MIHPEHEEIIFVVIIQHHRGNVGRMIENAVLDIIRHICNAKLSNVPGMSTPIAHPLMIIHITPIKILITIIFSPLRSTPSILCI
jgi:hypothetical protein